MMRKQTYVTSGRAALESIPMAGKPTWPRDEFNQWRDDTLGNAWAAAVAGVEAATERATRRRGAGPRPPEGVDPAIVELHQLNLVAHALDQAILAAVAAARDNDIPFSALADALGFASPASARVTLGIALKNNPQPPDPDQPPSDLSRRALR